MPDPLRTKLVSESASGMARASMSPLGATRNWVRFACVIPYDLLRFWGFLKIWEARFSTQVHTEYMVVAMGLSALI